MKKELIIKIIEKFPTTCLLKHINLENESALTIAKKK